MESIILNEDKSISYPNQDKLIYYLKYLESKEWAESYFNLAKYILSKYEIHENNKHLGISLNKKCETIKIIIGNRDILAHDLKKDKYSISLIMSLNHDKENAKTENVIGIYEFKKTKRHPDDVLLLHYDKGNKSFSFNQITIIEWENAVENQFENAEKCRPANKKDQSMIYDFIMNDNYRKDIMKRAWEVTHVV